MQMKGDLLRIPEERITLLKAGFTNKTIERLYIERNNFKIVQHPFVLDLVELDNNISVLESGIKGLSPWAGQYRVFECCLRR